MDFTAYSARDLLRLHAQVLDELRLRKIVRSANGPGGDYAELLFSTAFQWTLEGNSSSGHDAVDQTTGARHQIKCRRLRAANASRQLSFIRNLPSKPFDFLAGVLFDQQFPGHARGVPHDVVKEKSSFVSHVNAWRFLLRDNIWELPGVQDVTERLYAANMEFVKTRLHLEILYFDAVSTA
jgi:hypothetical protein